MGRDKAELILSELRELCKRHNVVFEPVCYSESVPGELVIKDYQGQVGDPTANLIQKSPCLGDDDLHVTSVTP